MNTKGHDVFWGEMAPCEHLLQIYEDDAVLLDTLTGFVAGGLQSGESAVVIATAPHLEELERRLAAAGVDVAAARSDDQFIALRADRTLARFMVQGWPDENRFNEVISEIVVRARGRGRRVRAFGEMVALLWAQGHVGATVRLEHLWNKLCKAEAFSLFCAYPKAGFTKDSVVSLADICAAHTRQITAA